MKGGKAIGTYEHRAVPSKIVPDKLLDRLICFSLRTLKLDIKQEYLSRSFGKPYCAAEMNE